MFGKKGAGKGIGNAGKVFQQGGGRIPVLLFDAGKQTARPPIDRNSSET